MSGTQQVQATRRDFVREIMQRAADASGDYRLFTDDQEQKIAKLQDIVDSLGLDTGETIAVLNHAGKLKLTTMQDVADIARETPSIERLRPLRVQAGLLLVAALGFQDNLPFIQTSNPDGQQARTDRLAAAEQDTGFKLGQEVQIMSCGTVNGEGKIVGFARVTDNIDDSGTTRKLVVQTDTAVYAKLGGRDDDDANHVWQAGQVLVSPDQLYAKQDDLVGSTAGL
jgi:hypothetical protein